MEYIQFRDELMRELREAVDPVTGEKVFEEVLPREEIHSGRFFENAPDIYIRPTRYEWAIAEEHVGEVSKPWHHPWGGFHREDGIFVASGPMVQSGENLPALEMTQVMLVIRVVLGMPIPEWVEADPPEGLLTDEFVARYPVRRKAYPELLAKYEGEGPRETDDTGGEDLLQGLGYIN
jgi:hypothetical protein